MWKSKCYYNYSMQKIGWILCTVLVFGFSQNIYSQQNWGKDPFKVNKAPEAIQQRINAIKAKRNKNNTTEKSSGQQSMIETERKFVEKLKLTGIWQSGAERKAMISGQKYQVGNKLASFTVKDIEKKQVTLSGSYDTEYILWLKQRSYQRDQVLKRKQP